MFISGSFSSTEEGALPPALGRGRGILQTSHAKVTYFSIMKSNKINFAECFNDFSDAEFLELCPRAGSFQKPIPAPVAQVTLSWLLPSPLLRA